MRCKSVCEYLDAFRTGELPATQAQAIDLHLYRCTACSREMAGLQRLALHASQGLIRTPASVLKRVLEASGDHYGEVSTELGKLWVGFSIRGITMVSPVGTGSAAFEQSYLRRRGRVVRAAPVPVDYVRAVRQAAAGKPLREAPVDLTGLASFEREVLLLLRKIPRGEVRPYLWLAREAGRPKAVRAVGTAMARNPVPFLLPCHRVVPANGGIGNYAFGSDLKRDLLRREGTPVEELEQLAAGKVRYIGCNTTNIYCFPTCRHARRIQPKNRVLLAGAAQAGSAGYRPCRHCKPDAIAS